MEWYEKLGFFENPFEINLFKTDNEPIGLENEKEEALYRVASGSMTLIEGEEGTGKTAILKHMIDNFKGKGKVIYVNAKKLNRGLDVEKLLINSSGMKGKLFKKKPKGMILLLDNVNTMTKKNALKIKYYFDQDYLHSVVLTTKNFSESDLDGSIKDRVDKRVITLKPLKKAELTELIKKRTGDKEVFKDDIIQAIVAESDSAKSALSNAEIIAEHIAIKGEVNKEKVEQILSKSKGNKQDEDEDVYKCLNCGKKMKQVGEHWRCEDCEDYCDSCGASIDDEDKTCPVCGVEIEE